LCGLRRISIRRAAASKRGYLVSITI
jgi:hypothetical protein